MKKAICFVDDDEDELSRFRENMDSRYIIGAGADLDAALNQLESNRVEKPDLFLLDLYYGPTVEVTLRNRIQEADKKLTAMEDEIRALLLEAKQSPEVTCSPKTVPKSDMSLAHKKGRQGNGQADVYGV